MHRSRLSVLAIFAAAAACSTHDDSDATEMLSKDSTLVSTLEVRQRAEPRQPLPEACGAVEVAAQPVVANKPLADFLARRGYDAELLGNTQQARALFRRASELDGTDKSIAYHLGRSNEAAGDRAGAMTAYCRYLALAPTAFESAEARERVAALSRSETKGAAVSAGNGVQTPRVSAATPQQLAPAQTPVEPRVAVGIPVERPARGPSTGHATPSSSAAPSDVGSEPTLGDGVATSPDADAKSTRTADGAEMVATPSRDPVAEQPSTVPSSQSRGPSRAQAAGIGAIAGAIIGAATGRSVKSAVIGAASGGVLGTVVGGGGVRPSSRSIRPWAASQQTTRARSARVLYRMAPAT